MSINFNIRTTLKIVISVLFLVFQFYLAFVKPLPPLQQNPIHWYLALGVAFCWFPFFKGTKLTKIKKVINDIIDFSLIGVLALLTWYFISRADWLMNRIEYLDPLTLLDYSVVFLTLILLLEAVRRTIGWNLLFFIGLFLLYMIFGKHMPGMLKNQGTDLEHFSNLMILSTDGVFGTPINASANFLYYFIIFGALFAACGGGKVLMDLGMKVGKGSGGPAKAAVASSAFVGSVNGSAVANVSTTGVLTIPLMKKTGYSPEEAGAIEACASTSGQILPPIMGIGAFIMADLIGIPYGRIALAAAIPAATYVLALFLLVDFLARRKKLKEKKTAAITNVDPIIRRLYLLIPIILLFYEIVKGASLMFSAIYGIIAILIINFLRLKNGLNLKELFQAFLNGTKQATQVAIPTAACGIIIGVVVMSGLSSSMGAFITGGSSNLLVALLIVGAGCIILGMALPTVAAYLSAYILFVPVLVGIGVDPLPANLFVFYFGVIAQITPPVCLASFAAAGIAGSNAWKTAINGFKYALNGFLVPFVFVFKPEILFEGTIWETISATLILFIGTFFLVASISGYLWKNLDSFFERFISLVVAILIIFPENITSIVGFILGGFLIFYAILSRKKQSGSIDGSSHAI